MSHKIYNDEKETSESDTDDNQEVFVHNSDLREPIHELGNKSFQQNAFIKCIGQLCMDFNYPQQDYKKRMTGTGTVIQTKSNGLFSSATAFVLTAAHNAYHTVWNCCNSYFEQFNHQGNKITNCGKCLKSLDKKTDSTIIKATSIVFKRRTTNRKEFGTMKQRYDCKIECIEEFKYKAFPYPKSGYDWILLSMKDEKNYYWNNCKKIQLEELKESKDIQFMIVGYPGDKKDQMWGYRMNQNGTTVEYKTSSKTKNIYLTHKEIDASCGQSGAAIATEKNGETIIWGIHVGGNKKHKYNVGTLLNEHILCRIEAAVNNKHINQIYKKKGIISERFRVDGFLSTAFECSLDTHQEYSDDEIWQALIINGILPMETWKLIHQFVQEGEWLICDQNNIYLDEKSVTGNGMYGSYGSNNPQAIFKNGVDTYWPNYSVGSKAYVVWNFKEPVTICAFKVRAEEFWKLGHFASEIHLYCGMDSTHTSYNFGIKLRTKQCKGWQYFYNINEQVRMCGKYWRILITKHFGSKYTYAEIAQVDFKGFVCK
eukprot:242748_1